MPAEDSCEVITAEDMPHRSLLECLYYGIEDGTIFEVFGIHLSFPSKYGSFLSRTGKQMVGLLRLNQQQYIPNVTKPMSLVELRRTETISTREM